MFKELKLGVVLVMFASTALGGVEGTVLDAAKAREVSALFNQFETIFYASADLLASSSGYKLLHEQNARFLRYPFAYLQIAAEALGKSTSIEMMKDADYILIGAKDFLPPKGRDALGPVRYRFCSIIHTRSQSEMLKGNMLRSPSVSSVQEGIWKWSAEIMRDGGYSESHTFYATRTAHSQILISNSFNDLNLLSQKLSAKNKPEALSRIFDWGDLHKQVFWGYRHYLHKRDENKAAAGTIGITPDTQAISFFIDFKHSHGVLRLYSPSAGTANSLNATGMLLLKAIRSGTWQMMIPLSDNLNTYERMFIVLGLFGFGIAL
jgi:hypothetical protein